MNRARPITDWSQLPMILDVVMVCLVLNISESTALRLLRSGEIPAVRVGKLWRVYRDDLRGYLDGQLSYGKI